MKATVHLVFAGQCRAAFARYEELLGGKIDLMLSYGDSPLGADVPPDWRDKIVHAGMTVGDLSLAGADAQPAQYQKPQGFYLLLNIATPAEAERIFAALAEGGTVHMPLQQTFWSPRFGVLVDRFGTPWEVTCDAKP